MGNASTMNITGGKTKSFARGDHGADQPTQTDKPVGPFPKSMPASPTKKDGGV
ncbi:MAG: hypothetical protein ACYTEQ_23760 [Planctomycetota bacterium]|jgi:hypothetical protein